MAVVTSAVEITQATVEFESAAAERVTAIADVSLAVRDGGFVTIIGPSGCGKSTLLRAVADLVDLTSGQIKVFGNTPAQARKARDFSFVFQEATLLPWLTAIQNVSLPLEVGLSEAQVEHKNDPVELLGLVGMAGRENALPHELSGGMRQRVAIARALVCKPRVLLMDEPFGALDEIKRDHLNNALLDIWRETGTTILFVTHSIPEAAYLGQQTLVLTGSTPGRVAEVFDIDLPAERDSGLLDTMEFLSVTKHLRALLSSGAAQ